MNGQRDVEQIKALLEKNEQEKLRLMRQLSRAQVGSSNMSKMPPSTYNLNACPGGSVMSRSSTTGLHVQPQPDQQEQSRPMKRSKTTHPTETPARPLVRAPTMMVRQRSSPRSLVVDTSGAAGSRLWPARHSLPAVGPYAMDYLGQLSMPNPFFPDPSAALGVVTGREMNVAEFLSMRGDDALPPPAASPIAIPAHGLPSPLESEKDAAASYPSLCGSSASTLDTVPMSRNSSSLTDGASISSQFNQMVRIQSQQSVASFLPNPMAMAMASQASLRRKRSSDGQLIIPHSCSSSSIAAAPARHRHPMEPSLSQSSAQSASSSGELGGHALSQPLCMERSDSARSNSSLKHRAKEALARQNHAAKSRQLQPKPIITSSASSSSFSSSSSPSSATTTTTTTTTTTFNPSSNANPHPALGNDGASKAPIAKAKYERPRHPRVKCMQCNDHPDGFRGEHELRRHTEAKHRSMVKKWICRDPALEGIPHAETAVRPLADCNKCTGKKQYGAYYNAAAHLRRTHFNVKPRKGGKAPGTGAGAGAPEIKDASDKRGGKGGGGWPSMTELKNWMVEVLVPMDQPGAFSVEDGEEPSGAPEGAPEEGGEKRLASASTSAVSTSSPVSSSSSPSLSSSSASAATAATAAAAAAATASSSSVSLKGFDATAAFDAAELTHFGGLFESQGYALAGLHADALALQGDLDSLCPPLDGAALVAQGAPSGLDFGALQHDVDVDMGMGVGMGVGMGMGMGMPLALDVAAAPSLSMMALDGYVSPGSSTATITKAGFLDPTLSVAAGGLSGDAAAGMAELDFGLAFVAR
ncbi:hypothetical protein VTJ83DRAFT_6926 [Remersonia thermophila]|uniref:DUF7896 domain-containing protein n=1 Tax=Remersonia thermophila TaxID=72144 RepID=A0ABR4D639_9PEZI